MILRDLILLCSGMAAGAAIWLGTLNLNAFARGQHEAGIWYAIGRYGLGIVVLLVAEAVFRAPAIPSSWRVWSYVVGLLMVFVGYVGIAFDQREGRHG